MAESKYRKRFDNDYKREIVRLVDELGKSPHKLQKISGLAPKRLGVGLKSSVKRAQTHFPAKAGSIQPMKNCGR